MCGITGFCQLGAKDLDQTAHFMAEGLLHRGPDDSGIWSESDRGIAFGFRRLAILDLTSLGHQPMHSESGRFVIVFNGEIYNFLEIKKELIGKGCKFRGGSDTEVMLASFETWEIEQAVKKFNGMFAFAVWDSRERKLSLVRDRIGKKPLYYGWGNKCFFFGSQLNAIKRHPFFCPQIDRNALNHYMQRGYIPSPFSIYGGIYKLIPGSILNLSEQDLYELPQNFSPFLVKNFEKGPTPYWDLIETAIKAQEAPFKGNEAEALKKLKIILRDSVEKRMVSDVPLGAFLSGGVDSSLVVAIMQSLHQSPVKTFSIGFEDSDYDEAAYAGQIAQYLKTDHTEHYISESELLNIVPQLPQMYDEPLADASQIPTYLVSHLAKQHVTVALTGDGGDELFVGYNRYIWPERIFSILKYFPLVIREIVAHRALKLSPGTRRHFAHALSVLLSPTARFRRAEDLLEKLLGTLSFSNPDEIYNKLTTYWPVEAVLGNQLIKSQYAIGDFHMLSDFLLRTMFLDLGNYLPEDLLAKVDRASMAASLEIRSPLLDYRLIEFAATIPSVLRIKNGEKKYLLRSLLAQYLPRELFERPKMGFSAPVGRWLGGSLRGWAEDLLDESLLKREGYFDATLIRSRYREQQCGRYNWQNELWTVLMFQAWNHAQYQERDPPLPILLSSSVSTVEPDSEVRKVKISVVIPAFNEERILAETIAAVKANDFPVDDYEIIIVNNGSTDRTSEIVRRANVKLVECNRRFVGAARNLGVESAQGEYLAFLDADCVPHSDWLREGLKSLELEPCITGAVCGIPKDAEWLEKAWFSQKRSGRAEVAHINSGNLFVPRRLFAEVGGFDETMSSGEDAEFCCRAKTKVRVIADDRIQVVHFGNPKTIKAFLKREIWHGIGAIGSFKHSWFDKPLIGTVLFSLFLILQLFGFVVLINTGKVEFLVEGTVGIGSIVAGTVLYRIITGSPKTDFAALFLLYCIYYLGRMIAIGMIIIGRGDYQRTR